MKTGLIIQIILIVSLFGIIFTGNVEAASYQKDTTRYTYLTKDSGSCRGGTLIDNYGGFIDSCDNGAVCTTVLNENSGKNEVGCFIPIPAPPDPTSNPSPQPPTSQAPIQTPTQAPVRRPPGLAAPLPVCTKDFRYNECIACNRSRPVYTDSCTGEYSTGSEQNDTGCSSFNCDKSGSTGSPVSTNPNPSADSNPSTNDSAPAAPITVKYRVATSQLNLNKAQWQTYTSGGVTVSAPSQIYSIDSTAGNPKAIFVQFLDSDGRFIKFSNGSEVYVEYINLERTNQTATIETSPSISGTNKTWGSNLVKVNISGFAETGKTLVEVFFRNPIGSCNINTCGFLGWTKIRSYGTNGFDQFEWTPKPGDVAAGVHMFGIFSLHPNGEVDKILSVSPTNYISE